MSAQLGHPGDCSRIPQLYAKKYSKQTIQFAPKFFSMTVAILAMHSSIVGIIALQALAATEP